MSVAADHPPGRPHPSGGSDVFLSVIVPAYKKEAQLPRLLRSLTGDAVPAGVLEVVVVDDASPDATAEVAADWAARDPAATRASRPPAANGSRSSTRTIT
jgi:CDP-glycerol glycerophosphotransferase